jgi:hypothetical protein
LALAHSSWFDIWTGQDASIDENLELMYDGFSELPGFTAVKQNGLYIGIEDPDFGVLHHSCP